MYKLFHICLLLFCLSVISFGQQKSPMNCGTVTTDAEIEQLKKNKKFAATADFRGMEVSYIPIIFHLVATNEGNGRITLTRLLEGLCKLNEDFAETNLQFYLGDEVNEIDNSAMYDLEFPNIPAGVRTQFAIKRVQGAVNIFVGNQLSSGNSGFYTSNPDIIFMNKRYVNAQDVILAHELGHLLGLPHTFLGWEETTYDPESPTPTEVFRGERSFEVEYVDREANCENSGDFFCGTPADYILDWNGGCDYQGGAVDPDSVLLDPDESNFMAYYSFNGCAQYRFADDQEEAMIANYISRGELAGTNIVPSGPVSDIAALISPEDGIDLPFNGIVLEWEPAENATHYMVDVSRLPNFLAIESQLLTKETSIALDDLQEGKKYYWRITSFNRSNTCELLESEARNFTTVENTSSLSEQSTTSIVSIFPNPAHTDSQLFIESRQNLGTSSIELYYMNGTKVATEEINIGKGANALQFKNTLSKGNYILKISNAEVLNFHKLLIL